ncbi:MAG: hypothetical protein J0H08_01940 [Rhizobiales bacterium]|nr:hypothetical protein [Hyphomicrobiales bacterium]
MGTSIEGALGFEAPDDIRAAIAAIGRTEDVRFSPDGRRLLIAGFGRSRLLVLDIAVEDRAGTPRLRIAGALEIDSPDLHEPHGADFAGPDHVVVANRSGTVVLLPLPAGGSGLRRATVAAEPLGPAGFAHVETPGSVAVVPVHGDRYRVLVCNNFAHHVTRHRLVLGRRPAVGRSAILLRARLNVPDGIAVSPSRRWIAVSSHFTNSVMLYRAGWLLGEKTAPAGELVAAGYPHGVRFTADGRFVVVADAGGPVVRIYAARGDDWRGEREALRAVHVIDDDAFRRGRHNPEEGGPKGIDIDAGSRVIAVTCEEQPLAFFDFRAMLEGAPPARARPAHAPMA